MLNLKRGARTRPNPRDFDDLMYDIVGALTYADMRDFVEQANEQIEEAEERGDYAERRNLYQTLAENVLQWVEIHPEPDLGVGF